MIIRKKAHNCLFNLLVELRFLQWPALNLLLWFCVTLNWNRTKNVCEFTTLGETSPRYSMRMKVNSVVACAQILTKATKTLLYAFDTNHISVSNCRLFDSEICVYEKHRRPKRLFRNMKATHTIFFLVSWDVGEPTTFRLVMVKSSR